MAGVINPSDIAFNGKQIQSLSEAILTRAFSNKKLSEIFTIATGIKQKQQIAFLGSLGLTGKKQTGCDPSVNPGTITMSEKTWNPVYIGDRFAQCFTDLLPSFWGYGLKNGISKSDLTSTDFANFLEQRIGESVNEAIMRHAWFGDPKHTVSGDTANSGNQLLTAGLDKLYFNPITGAWSQIFSIVAGDATKRLAIAANTGSTYAAQAFTAADTTNKTVTNLLQNTIYAADFRLREDDTKFMLVTQSVADQYAKEYKATTSIPLAFEAIYEGIKAFQIDGVNVIAISQWDRVIKAYFDNGTSYNLPHRILLTTPSNLTFGTEEESNLAELDPFYDKKTKNYYVDYGFNMDVKVLENYMLQVAY